MTFHIEYEMEADGRWIAEAPEIPGVRAYGTTAAEAIAKAETLALRALAEGDTRPHTPGFVAHLLAVPKADKDIGHLSVELREIDPT